ncbi:hypothetical protein SAMN02745165_01220 [Malonomonas rubra DSM 5091]|uniref:Lipoprotein n=1 Tax=Malonomonas rubra DSM 5091 TaxID=1122189 RepID=A0A1M6FB50_MALRU|nr:hypothetical protein [Malonomonas rubra]SHI94974.1 hypothetical protein SAMN02745165_01220 [Malonomonas rubra DSM 5091]
MKKNLIFGLILLLAGCSWGQYQVPKENYRAEVQVLGVLPILVDQAAHFDYPQKNTLIDLIVRSAADKQMPLVEQLREKKGYFDVRALPGNAELLGLSLLSAELPRVDDGRPTGYQYNAEAVRQLAEQNVVDGLLVVVIAGTQVTETRRSRTLLESLETSYNDIVATAEVVDRNGKVLWRLSGKEAVRMLLLQYPDFDEAHYNLTDVVKVKNISLAGIERALEAEEGELPQPYQQLIERIVKGISPRLFE